ncbi:MAG: DUF362 domain-containing protein [Candidatus Omnitrophica bacterium]|jgi:uncharacterized protein (DUF362 family)/NAD-dependent dihydropyrimidine dehydrogenase PreA subunit|nr:DUF362 domain-containing protein [Candidatus Omnitrophota bacterium]
MNAKVSIVKCKDYEPGRVLEATRRAVDLIGGISSFIRPKSRVLVKPNLLMAIEPESAVDTHPEVVRAAIKILKDINCVIYVGDGPSAFGSEAENIDEVHRRSGMKKICEEEDVELVKFDKRRWRGKFPLSTWPDDCDYVLNLPKLKTHNFMLMTAAIKNLFGLVSGTFKTELHKKYFPPHEFARIVVDIYEKVNPALTIIDSVLTMEGDGPGSSGEPRNTGLILAGSDCVALDTVSALIMGLNPFDVLITKEASIRGLGVSDINSISIVGQRLDSVIGEPFKLPATSMVRKIPRPVIEIVKKFIRYYPHVKHDNCTRCLACVEACPSKVISLEKNRITIKYAKCIACFCCQEVCPSAAIKVRKSILAKMIGL